MTIYWIYLSVCLLSMTVVLVVTPLIKIIAIKYEQLDIPSDRKVHQKPTVRLGGVAIFVATLSPLLCFLLTSATEQFTEKTLYTLLLLLLVGSGFFLVGLADDLFKISPFHRLWMQAVGATALWGLGIRIDTLVLPGSEPISLSWLSLPITVLWIVGVVNAINWIDGLDGLAAGVAGIAAAILVILGIVMAQPLPALVGMALLGSLLGFLYYNYSPAKIFMGDGGAYFVGFMLGSLCIVGPQHLESPSATVLPLVILAIPIGDMVSVILTRLYRKQSPFHADNLHLHHRLLNLNLSHTTTVWVIYALTLATSSSALMMVGIISSLAFAVGLSALLSVITWRLVALSTESDVVIREEIWYSKNP